MNREIGGRRTDGCQRPGRETDRQTDRLTETGRGRQTAQKQLKLHAGPDDRRNAPQRLPHGCVKDEEDKLQRKSSVKMREKSISSFCILTHFFRFVSLV